MSFGEEPFQDILGHLKPRRIPDSADERDPNHSVVPIHAAEANGDGRGVEHVLSAGVPVWKVERVDVGADYREAFERDKGLQL